MITTISLVNTHHLIQIQQRNREENIFPHDENFQDLLLTFIYNVGWLICFDQLLSRVRIFATLCTIVRQALLSMGFSRQESWSGLPFPPPGDLPNSGIEPASPTRAGGFVTTEPLGKPTYSSTAVLITLPHPQQYVSYSWRFAPFDHSHPIPASPTTASGNHKSGLFFFQFVFCRCFLVIRFRIHAF